MKLLSVETRAAPRLSQVGLFETRSGAQVSVYFSSTKVTKAPTHTDHFFIIGALAAYLRGEKYIHSGAVDPVLYHGFHAAMGQWDKWWRHRPINISAEIRSAHAQPRGTGTACLMSCGVDSAFTLTQHDQSLSTLIHLIHSPRPGSDRAAHGLYETMTGFAQAMDKDLIGVETNLMTAFDEIEDSWTTISHGACMAAVGHFLSAELSELIISASFAQDQQRPWGSHPLIDPLMSSSEMAFRHEGEAYNRFEKHCEIAREPIILQHLSVCEHGPQSGAFVNCSKCQKCLRSMITLDLLEVEPSAAPSFDWSDYNPADIKRFLLPGHVNCSELLAYAEQVGRADITAILQDVIAYSEQHHWIVDAEQFVRRRFKWILKYKRALKRLRGGVYGLLNIRMRRL